MTKLQSHINRIENLTLQELVDATAQHGDSYDVLERLNIPKTEITRQLIITKLADCGMLVNYKPRGSYGVDQLIEVVPKCDCFSGVGRALKISICTYNLKKLKQMCIDNNIDTSHFTPNRTRLHTKKKSRAASLEDVLIENSTFGRSALRGFLIRKGLYTGICAECGLGEEWNGKKLTIELDHVNGDHRDNRPENLRWLCPNCHSQTATFKRGKI